MEIIHNRPQTQIGPPDMFTGNVLMDRAAVAAGDPQRLAVIKVHFAPGARSAWHSHPVGQILLVLDGVGRVQDRGGPVEEIRSGDAVITAPDVVHWHGAAPGTSMTNLAIQQSTPSGAGTDWGDHVTDAEYGVEPG